MSERWLSKGSRLASGALIAGIIAGVVMSQDDGLASSDWIAVLIAGVLAGGFVAGSWLALPLLPAAVLAAGLLVKATNCPDCGGGGEETPFAGVLFILAGAMVLLAMLGGLGVAASKLLGGLVRERREAVISLAPPLLVTVPVALGLFAGAMLAIRYQSNRDANGPVVASTGRVNFRPGPKWEGKANDNQPDSIGQFELDNFSEYTLWWFGASFAGYNLQAAIHHPGSLGVVNGPGSDSVSLVYGFCGPAPCPPPVQVRITPACAVTPPLPVALPPETLPGGAILQRFRDEGHWQVWTGGVSLDLHLGPGTPGFETAIAALRPIAEERPASPPPPDFSGCPGA